MPIRLLQIINSMDDSDINATVARVSMAMAADGMQVTVLGLQGDGSLSGPLRESGVDVRWIEPPIRQISRLTCQIRRLIQQNRPDVVHTWTEQSNCLGRLAAITTHVPRVISSRRAIPRRPALWAEGLERSLMYRTETCVVNSSTALDSCRERGLPQKKLRLIVDGVPVREPLSTGQRADVRRRLGLSPATKLVGVVGPLVPSRRVKDAIWSADLLRVFYPDFSCLIVGEGPSLWRLNRYAGQVGANDRTQFLLCRSDWVKLIGALDCLCQASQRESMPMAVLEAMSAGVPVVATDIPGHRELIGHNRTGLLVSVGDRGDMSRQVYNSIEDRVLAERLSTAAQRYVHERFSVDKMVRSYGELYRQPHPSDCPRSSDARASSPSIP